MDEKIEKKIITLMKKGNKRMNEWMNETKNKGMKMNERRVHWVKEIDKLNEQMNEWMNFLMNKGRTKWMTGWMNKLNSEN